MAYYLAIDTILITSGGVQRRFNRGDELVDVPDGVMGPLIRLQRVTTELPPAPPIVPADPEPVEVQESGTSTGSDWRETAMASLDLPHNVQESLAEAGLATVADVLKYGAEHNGSIQSLKGIGAASERAIQEAIASIAPKE